VPGGLSQDDVDQIREGYELFRQGDPAFLDRFDPDATILIPESLPKGGIYRSPLEALEYFNNIGELFEDANPEPEEFIRDGDRLVVLGRFHGRSRATGEQISVRFAHVYGLTSAEERMSEQKYTSFELIGDTASVLAALAEEDRE
jgi:ketosteroid isomerase-like protein